MSEQLSSLWLEGGWAMYPIALVGCLLYPASLGALLTALVAKRPLALTLGLVLLAVGFLPAVVGELGYLQGVRAVEQAVAGAHPDDRATIMMAGRGEAMACLIFGLFQSLVPVFSGSVLTGWGLAQRLPKKAVVSAVQAAAA